MVNLISPATRARLLRLYYTRFITVLATTVGVAFLISAVLMMPTYFFIHAEADQAAEYVQTANQIATQRAKGSAQETLSGFHESVKLLTASNRDPSFAHILGLLTSDLSRGVSLSAIAVTYDDAGNAKVAVDGIAKTRAELIAYTAQLKKIGEFTNLVVPVGDLVADIDSTFSVSFTWVRPKKP